MNSSGNVRRRFVVNGQVQGVGFRFWARREALRVGVVGFVRNLPDGRVETVAEGAQAAVSAFGALLREGSPRGTVTGVDIRDEVPRPGEFNTFDIAF